HGWRRVLHTGKNAADVHSDRGIELRQVDAGDTGACGECSRIVEEAVQTPEAPDGVLNHRPDVRLDTHIRTNEACGASESGGEFLALVLSPACDDDASTLRDEQLCGTRANAARRTGDHRDLPVKRRHLLPSTDGVQRTGPWGKSSG